MGSSRVKKTRNSGTWTTPYIGAGGYWMAYTESGYGRVPRRVHRLVWEDAYGPIPEGYHIDHINGDRLDNRLENLRLATNQENMRNIKVKPYTNITKRGNSYRVRIVVDNVSQYFGSYGTLEEAQKVRDLKRKELFGEFSGVYEKDEE